MAKWYDFFDESKYSVTGIYAPRIVYLDGRKLVIEEPTDPGIKPYVFMRLEVEAPNAKSRSSFILLDSENDKWTYVSVKRHRGVEFYTTNFPPRYRFTKDDKRLIYKQIAEMLVDLH